MRYLIPMVALCAAVAPESQAQFADVTETRPAVGGVNRAELNMDWPWVAAIAYAKTMGQTPEEYGRFIGELSAPGWTAQSPAGFVLRMYRNYCGWDGITFEVLEVSDRMIRVRTNVPYQARVAGAGDPFGVTVEDYVKMHEAAYDAIAAHLGFVLTRQRGGDGTIVTVSKRG